MRCPRCGSSTRVTETRHPDHSARLSISSSAGKAESAVGWYTSNWIARTRQCLNEACGAKTVTVEISLEDLNDGFARQD